MTLLCREALGIRTSSNMYNYYSSSTRIIQVYNISYWMKTVPSIHSCQKEMISWTRWKESEDVEKLLNPNKLKVDQKLTISQKIVNYYNSLYKWRKQAFDLVTNDDRITAPELVIWWVWWKKSERWCGSTESAAIRDGSRHYGGDTLRLKESHIFEGVRAFECSGTPRIVLRWQDIT